MKFVKVFFVVISCLALIMFAIVILANVTAPAAPAPAAAAAPETPSLFVPRVGDIVGVRQTIMGATKDDLNRALDLFNTGDRLGIQHMIVEGRAFITDDVFSARVLDLTPFMREIRVADGALTGVSGWVVAESVVGRLE